MEWSNYPAFTVQTEHVFVLLGEGEIKHAVHLNSLFLLWNSNGDFPSKQMKQEVVQ